MRWEDYRIQDIDEETVKLTNFGNFWIPTVNFRNALSASMITTLNRIEFLQVNPQNQSLRYCSRVSVEFICELELPNFPFDEHFCQFQLENCKFLSSRTVHR